MPSSTATGKYWWKWKRVRQLLMKNQEQEPKWNNIENIPALKLRSLATLLFSGVSQYLWRTLGVGLWCVRAWGEKPMLGMLGMASHLVTWTLVWLDSLWTTVSLHHPCCFLSMLSILQWITFLLAGWPRGDEVVPQVAPLLLVFLLLLQVHAAVLVVALLCWRSTGHWTGPLCRVLSHRWTVPCLY